jgi:hypothetical protein
MVGHSSGSALPIGAQKPAKTGEHKPLLEAPVALEEVPPGHGTGSAAPCLQKKPGVQLSHTVAPRCACILPAGQSVQTSVPARAATLPGKHSRQASERLLPGIGLAFPAVQWTHELLLDAPRLELYVPPGHGVNVCRTLAAPSEAQ